MQQKGEGKRIIRDIEEDIIKNIEIEKLD